MCPWSSPLPHSPALPTHNIQLHFWNVCKQPRLGCWSQFPGAQTLISEYPAGLVPYGPVGPVLSRNPWPFMTLLIQECTQTSDPDVSWCSSPHRVVCTQAGLVWSIRFYFFLRCCAVSSWNTSCLCDLADLHFSTAACGERGIFNKFCFEHLHRLWWSSSRCLLDYSSDPCSELGHHDIFPYVYLYTNNPSKCSIVNTLFNVQPKIFNIIIKTHLVS